MDEATTQLIENEVLPIVQSGRAVLFLGAGFSYGTPTTNGLTIPDSKELVERILKETGNVGIDPNDIDLETAFSEGEDEIKDFKNFIENNFLCREIFDWQVNPFSHWWRRVFTTNIDNVIDRCVEAALTARSHGPEFNFYNYRDRVPAIHNPLHPPVVYLHGRVDNFDEGFVFDRVAYADHTVKPGDWLRDAAFHLSYGECIIVGSKLKESDLEAEMRKRVIWEGDNQSADSRNLKNYIVLKSFNNIEKRSYIKRGIVPIEATAEEFFTYLSSKLSFLSQAKLLKRLAPHLRIELSNSDSVAWFAESFNHVSTVCSKTLTMRGIFSRFFTGDYPDWYYIANEVPAKFQYIEDILNRIRAFLSDDNPLLTYAITGPVASGKTTLAKEILFELSKTIESVYEYSSYEGINIDHAWSSLKNIKGVIVLYFDKSSEYFYAINELAKRFLRETPDAKLLIIIEERDTHYNRNEHHLFSISEQFLSHFRVPSLSIENAHNLYQSLKKVGLTSGKLSEKSEESAKRIIVDTERGFRGDLLATLCDVTSFKSFVTQLNEEYSEIETDIAKNAFKLLSIVTAARLSLPITYLSEILQIGNFAALSIIRNELKGKVYVHLNQLNISTRHYVIAEYHTKELMNPDEKENIIVELMDCVSKKFDITEIKKHPLPYRIYKSVLHHVFLKETVFPEQRGKIEIIYSRCQNFFAGDGIFWLQYGRYLYTENRYPDAEHCFRKGLALYDSFQIRHSLGQVLLKQYCVDNFCEPTKCEEGIDLLVSEITDRDNV